MISRVCVIYATVLQRNVKEKSKLTVHRTPRERDKNFLGAFIGFWIQFSPKLNAIIRVRYQGWFQIIIVGGEAEKKKWRPRMDSGLVLLLSDWSV